MWIIFTFAAWNSDSFQNIFDNCDCRMAFCSNLFLHWSVQPFLALANFHIQVRGFYVVSFLHLIHNNVGTTVISLGYLYLFRKEDVGQCGKLQIHVIDSYAVRNNITSVWVWEEDGESYHKYFKNLIGVCLSTWVKLNFFAAK